MPPADVPTPETPTPDAPKKGKRWLIPVVALLLGSAGAAAYTQSDSIRQSLTGGAAADSTAAEPPIEFGVFAELDGIVVNPRGTDGRRYLMVKLGVEAKNEKTLARLDELKPAAIDAVIDLLSAESVEVLGDISQREALKGQILDRFNRMLGDDGPVTRIYFTQYVLQ